MTTHTRRPHALARRSVLGLALAAVLLVGCGSNGQQPGTADAHSPAAGLPSEHVHGIAVNPADRRVYLATHDGLFRYDEHGRAARVGPEIDLMGFTVAGPNHFYASGHPHEDIGLPDPAGLIESRDGGHEWTPLSRQGQSDFHALATSARGVVVGYDGALRISRDGTTWNDLRPPVTPHAVAISPDGKTLLVTSESGLARSTDAGATWTRLSEAPMLMLVDWAERDTVAGVTPDGTVAVSTDTGVTWQVRGHAGGSPQAIGVAGPADRPRVLVVTDTAVLDSTDGGQVFRPLG
ncbi:MAG: BNR/Asp-box repeat domain protein [Cryptosporangiaceae bacterium]|jgi:DNA-binding beta-propeller fold protein YncE|nr:BNR/Asp-box repeat domain protein [Cryptosporangiaceae bacterium]